MSQSIVYKLLGPTTRLDVVNTVHKTVTVSGPSNEPSNYASFMNIGASPVHVVVVPQSVNNPPDAVFPTDGTPSDGFTVPPLMQTPMLVAVPPVGFKMSAISNSATATTLVVCPTGNL